MTDREKGEERGRRLELGSGIGVGSRGEGRLGRLRAGLLDRQEQE